MKYEVKRFDEAFKNIDQTQVIEEIQIPYNYAIVSKLNNGSYILSPVVGNMCLYFSEKTSLDEMIKFNKFPDIEGNILSPFRVYRNDFKNIAENESKLIELFALKTGYKKEELNDVGKFSDISKRVSELKKQNWDDTFDLFGIYIGYLIKKNSSLIWDSEISYEGFNPNWLPFLKSSNGTKVIFWRDIDREFQNNTINIRRLLNEIIKKNNF